MDELRGGSAHLDEVALSDLVDGRAEPAAEAHAATCPMCADRLAGWVQVRDRLAARPVAVPPAGDRRRESAVQAALDAAILDAADPGPAGGDAVPQDPRAPGASAATSSGGDVGAGRPSGWWRRGAGLAAAAAAVAAIAIGVSHLHGGSASESASRASSATTGPAGPARGSAAPVSGSGTGSTKAGPSAAASGTAASNAPGGPVADLGPVADRAALVAAVRHLTASPGASGGTSGAGTAETPAFAATGCPVPSSVTGTAVSRSSPLVLRARADYAGTAADVFVFATGASQSGASTSGAGHTVVVESAAGCHVIATATY